MKKWRINPLFPKKIRLYNHLCSSEAQGSLSYLGFIVRLSFLGWQSVQSLAHRSPSKMFPRITACCGRSQGGHEQIRPQCPIALREAGQEPRGRQEEAQQAPDTVRKGSLFASG